jgi:hypothetical protein
MHPMEPHHQSSPRAARAVGHRALAVLLASCALAGCVERRVSIETSPPGALVWINDVQVGRSPVGVEIVHDGIYDLRLEKEGYEPLVTPASAEGPVWDAVPLDFFAEILPIDARRETRWVFTLAPRDDSEDALVERAQSLRGRATEGAAVERPVQTAEVR